VDIFAACRKCFLNCLNLRMKIFFVLPLEIACWNKGTLMNDEVSESIDIIDISFEVVILEWSFKCLRNAFAVLNIGLASFPIHSGRRPNALFSNTPLSLRKGDDGGAVGRIHCDMAFEDPLEYPVLGGQREHSLGRLRVVVSLLSSDCQVVLISLKFKTWIQLVWMKVLLTGPFLVLVPSRYVPFRVLRSDNELIFDGSAVSCDTRSKTSDLWRIVDEDSRKLADFR